MKRLRNHFKFGAGRTNFIKVTCVNRFLSNFGHCFKYSYENWWNLLCLIKLLREAALWCLSLRAAVWFLCCLCWQATRRTIDQRQPPLLFFRFFHCRCALFGPIALHVLPTSSHGLGHLNHFHIATTDGLSVFPSAILLTGCWQIKAFSCICWHNLYDLQKHSLRLTCLSSVGAILCKLQSISDGQ